VDFKRLFAAAADGVLVMDEDGRYLHANPAFCRLTGYALAELRRMRVGDLTIPIERDEAHQAFERLCREEPVRAERVVRRKNGVTVPVEVTAAAVGDGTYVVILRDLSTRTRGEDELARALEAYSTLVELCHAAVVSAGRDGHVRSWNPAAEQLFGYAACEAIGKPIVELVEESLRDQHLRAFNSHLASVADKPFHRVVYGDALRKDGRAIPVEVSLGVGGPASDPFFTAVIRDISEHRDMVERLNDALQRLQFHVERMPLAYVVWDTQFRVVEWNPAAERVFGYPKAEVLGRHAYDLVVPPDARQAVDQVWADLLSGATSSHAVNPNVRKDGSRLVCEWFNTPLRDSAGAIRGVASMARDITEHEAMEARMRDAQKLESLGVLAGGVAHDFNSSLMVIMGNAALLRSSLKGISPRTAENIQLIEEASSRASLLIKHLLAYARTGRHNPQPTDINTIVQASVAFVQSSLGKNYELDVQLAKPLETVLADRGQVEQVLLNLCLNAKQAMLKGGRITIATRKVSLTAAQVARCVPFDIPPGDYVELLVADTGCGMDDSTRAKIFDPFFTTKPEGHGLGLAAVLGILRQHHGAARVESQLGKGTKMHVYFPVGG
jgi:PAS domain S-box-containing protein